MRVHRGTLLLFTVVCLNLGAIAQQVTLEHWDFLADSAGRVAIDGLKSTTGWRPARAGVSLNALFEDLRDFGGYAWYRTTIDVPEFTSSRHVLLRFGAVDYQATIYVNGVSVGEHVGGYTPFSFDITQRVHRGANEIAVRVYDVPPNDGRYKQIPHGKQNWYIQTSGLWQPVTIEYKPATYIDSVRVTATNDGQVGLQVALNGTRTDGGALRIAIRDRHGREVAAQNVTLTSAHTYEIATQVRNPELWSPDHPALYTAQVELTAEASANDSSTVRFGFRHLESRDGKLLLNGKPFYLIGALDQDFYPDTIYTPPSRDYVRREMELAKSLGLNTLRCHIKVCEPEYLDAADEVGILIWYEIPNWDQLTPEAAAAGERTFKEMVARDWNHPSIGIQSLINESWGIDFKSADQRSWLRGFAERAQQMLHPLGRLVVDNSACCNNFHLRTDINDFHQYYSIPDNTAKWDAWVTDFASRPKWTFSQSGDAQPTGTEPLIVSEFGNWGLPQLPADLPWWFTRNFENKDITRPAGVYDRFQEFKFNRIFPDYEALAQATQWHQFDSLKHEIEEMRRYGSINGYVITEFTDLNWESNGLLTMWREPKAYADDLRRIQQPDVIMARFPRRNFTSGESASVEVVLSHFSSRRLQNANVFWHTDTGRSGTVRIPGQPAIAADASLGSVAVLLDGAAQSRPSPVNLYLELRDEDEVLIAANRYTLYVFPRHQEQASLPTIRLYDPENRLPSVRDKLGPANAGNVMITTRWDESVTAFLHSGGRAIVLADSPDALPGNLPVKMRERKGDYDGNWISNFAWVVPRSPIFRDIAVNPIMGWEAALVTPRFVLQGVEPAKYDDVLAGMFYGWINNNAPLLVQGRYGGGLAIVTTFRFDQYASDPYSRALLDSLIRYVASDECKPTLELSR